MVFRTVVLCPSRHCCIESWAIQYIGLRCLLLKTEGFPRRRKEPGRFRFPQNSISGNRERIQALLTHNAGATGHLPNPIMLLKDDHPMPPVGQLASNMTANRTSSNYYCVVQVSFLNLPESSIQFQDNPRYQL